LSSIRATFLLDKLRVGAFHGTDLERILRSSGIDTVVVPEIATNLCCETTARDAVQVFPRERASYLDPTQSG